MKLGRPIFLLLLLTASTASAVDIVWTNTTDGVWGNPANWSPNLVPGPPDTAQITNAGTYLVFMDVGATVSRLYLGGPSGTQKLNPGVQTLILRNPSMVSSNGIFELQGGTLDGAGDLLIEGKLVWDRGTMKGSGRTIIPEGYNYRFEGGYLGRPFELRGGGVIAYSVNGLPGGIITVFPDKTLEIISPGGLRSSGGVLKNYGTIRKTGSGESSIDFAVNNEGLLQTAAGNLNLGAGSTSSGTYTVLDGATLDFGGGIHTLSNSVVFSTTGSGRIRAVGGTINVMEDLTIEPPFELINGILDGDGSVVFRSGLTWSGGTMQGIGKSIIPSGATLAITGTTSSKFLLRDLDLHGNATLGGNYLQGNLYGGNRARLTIFPGATFEVLVGQRFIHYTGDPAVIDNQGTFLRSAGSQIDVDFVFNNSGQVQLQAGWLVLTRGGVNSGSYELSNGTQLVLGGGVHSMNAGSAFSATGSGFIRVPGGTFRVNNDLTMRPTFELTGQGTLDGDANITFSNTFNWSGGNLQGNGRTAIAENTRVAILGNSSPKTLLRAFDLRGYGSLSGTGHLLGGQSATFTVFPTGTFDLLDDPTLASANSGEVATLINQGLLRKPEGAGIATIGFNVANSGMVDCQSGTVRFSGAYQQSAGATVLNGGNFAGELLDLRGGQLTGAGNIDAPVFSAGDLFPGAPVGDLSISGASPRSFTAAAGNSLNIQIGGLTLGTSHDQLRVDGSATLAGTLNVDLVNSFKPGLGNSFTVMTYTARSGTFATISGPPGVYFTANYSDTALTLTTIPEEEALTPLHVLIPSGLVGTSTNRAFKVTMTGEVGRTYEIYGQTNVAAPFASWDLLGVMTPATRQFDFRDPVTPFSALRFYRAKQVP